jgi:hypothetical protein
MASDDPTLVADAGKFCGELPAPAACQYVFNSQDDLISPNNRRDEDDAQQLAGTCRRDEDDAQQLAGTCRRDEDDAQQRAGTFNQSEMPGIHRHDQVLHAYPARAGQKQAPANSIACGGVVDGSGLATSTRFWDGLEARVSAIPGAGMGLFAARLYLPGEVVCTYKPLDGSVICTRDAIRLQVRAFDCTPAVHVAHDAMYLVQFHGWQ